MGRGAIAAIIVVAVAVGAVGGVTATNGVISIFQAGSGSLDARLSQVESYLEDHSQALNLELIRVQGDIDDSRLTWRGLTVADEDRCSTYDSDDYRAPSTVEDDIVEQLGGIYGPYTGTWFASTRETDIEHIVARSEAHDSGLCAASAARKQAFGRDLLNLTLARPSVNRLQKSAYDAAEWLPELNECWYVNRVLEVRRAYDLTIDLAEAQAIDRVLAGCPSTEMRVLEPPASMYAPDSPIGIAIVCGTPAEADYLRDLWSGLEALGQVFQELVDEEALQLAFTDSADDWLERADFLQAVSEDLIGRLAPTERAQTLHDTQARFVAATMNLVSVLRDALTTGDASTLSEVAPGLTTELQTAADDYLAALSTFCESSG